jgi:hypothetical protein
MHMKCNTKFVNINSHIVKIDSVKRVDISTLFTESIIVVLEDNSEHLVSGFAALEILYLICPSVLEGNQNIRFKKHMWAIHNLFAHPLMQILAWFRLYKQAIWIHNITVPNPRGFK